ncbi:MAG: hypothetical protein ACFB2Z_08945 [Maricaulaceae bacterium]
MPRWEAVFTLAVFALPALALPLSVVGPADTSDLNRAPTPLPALSLSRFGEDAYRQQWSEALSDRFAWRAPISETHAKAHRAVFDESPDSQVRLGLEGWLFYTPALDEPTRWPEPDAQRFRSGVQAVKTRVEAQGRTFRMAVAPHKPSLYPEHLRPADRPKATVGAQRRDALLRGVRADPVAGYIDLFPAMAAAKARYDAPLYLYADSHWNDLGAAVAAKMLVGSLAAALWRDADLVRNGVQTGEQDLARLAHLPGGDIPSWRVDRAGVRVTTIPCRPPDCRQVEFYETRSDGPRLLPPIAAVIDSYGYNLRDLLPPYFESVALIHYNGADTSFARAKLADAEIVYIQVVERGMGWVSPRTPMGAWSAAYDALKTPKATP